MSHNPKIVGTADEAYEGGLVSHPLTRAVGGASWNRTSDLSIIRDVRQIPPYLGLSRSASFSLLIGSGRSGG
jgi:hypothetical protein